MIIALIAIVIIVILGVMLLNNNKKESDEVGKTEKSATKEDVKIVANEASKLTLEEYKTDQSSVLSYIQDFGYTKKDIDHRPCMEMFVEYEQYCKDTGFKPLKKVNFDREICEEFKFTKRCTTWNRGRNQNQCWRYV